MGSFNNKNPYYTEENVLKKYIEDNKQRFEVVVLPQTLVEPALQLAHEGLGHNGNTMNLCIIKMTILLERLKAISN